MKKQTPMILLLAVIASPAAAEVIKCKLASGKVIYQQTPCPSAAVSQDIIEIKKPDPHQVEEAQNKLKAWQAEEAANDAAEIKAAKEHQEEIDRQEAINALNRNAIAQQQQAIAAQRQAEALERRNNAFLYNGPYYGSQYYPSQTYGLPYNPSQHHGHHERRHQDDANPSLRDNLGANMPSNPQNQNQNRNVANPTGRN